MHPKVVLTLATSLLTCIKVTTFFTELPVVSESEESVYVAEELLSEVGILSFCCLSFDKEVLFFFDFCQNRDLKKKEVGGRNLA